MTKENLKMSVKEADRLGIMRQIDKKILTIRQAGEQLGVSLRQGKRIRKRYIQEGAQGLISRKRGLSSNNKVPRESRNRVIELLNVTYVGFGPTLASEKLLERDDIKLSAETLRKWMIEEGIWRPKKKRESKVYQRRTRRSRFGELLQGDGSPHDWLEGRSGKFTLLQFVDDATGIITAARFVPVETTEGYIELLQEHLEKYGRPLGLYVDKHSIFRVNAEELKKGIGITHFGRVLKDLEIELICAHSPQAKGRVERKNGVMQDRMIKEMRLHNINTMEEANSFLPGFIEDLNKRFGKEAVSPEDAHRPLRPQDALRRIFARRDTRKLSKDLTFQHHGILYMLETVTPNRLRYASVDVFWRGNGPIEVEYQGTKLQYRKWAETIYEKPTVVDSKVIEVMGAKWVEKKPNKPSKCHPWR